jgi:hypothetical protein
MQLTINDLEILGNVECYLEFTTRLEAKKQIIVVFNTIKNLNREEVRI